MNKIGIPISFFPAISPLRTIALTLTLASTLGLAACGSSDKDQAQDAQSKTSASASASKTAKPSKSSSPEQTPSTNSPSVQEEAIPENNPVADSLAQAPDAGANSEEVKTAEKLYNQVQDTLAKVQPVKSAAENPPVENPETEEEEANGRVSPKDYISPETVSQLEAVTTGSAFNQYIATANEYAMNGWQVEGSSHIVGTPKVAEGEYMGQKAKLLEVCLDSSQVKVLNSAGTQVNPTQISRSLNIFTLIEDNGEWKIASHDFPNNADC